MAFAEAALSDLTGLKADRVAGLMHDPSASGFAALHRRAGLPPVLLPAFVAALSAWREAGFQAEPGQAKTSQAKPGNATLSRRMIERALTACETMPLAEAQSVVALLARYEAEAAREEARVAAKAMEEMASRETRTRMQILDAEWRLAQQLVSPRPAQPVPLALQPVRIDAVTIEQGQAMESVLDALSDGLRASVREARAQVHPLAAAPIDLTGHDLVTIDVPSIVVSQPEFDIVPDPVRIEIGVSPTHEADAILDAIPGALIASYRADRDRMRLAA
jgi:hypothetical protein